MLFLDILSFLTPCPWKTCWLTTDPGSVRKSGGVDEVGEADPEETPDLAEPVADVDAVEADPGVEELPAGDQGGCRDLLSGKFMQSLHFVHFVNLYLKVCVVTIFSTLKYFRWSPEQIIEFWKQRIYKICRVEKSSAVRRLFLWPYRLMRRNGGIILLRFSLETLWVRLRYLLSPSTVSLAFHRWKATLAHHKRMLNIIGDNLTNLYLWVLASPALIFILSPFLLTCLLLWWFAGDLLVHGANFCNK